jgi:hypothetical protein
VLLALFWAALSYLSPRFPGREISIGTLGALAEEGRRASATFRDEDSIVTGSYVAAGGGLGTARDGPASPAPTGAAVYWAAYPPSGSVTAIVEMATKVDADVDVGPRPEKKREARSPNAAEGPA